MNKDFLPLQTEILKDFLIETGYTIYHLGEFDTYYKYEGVEIKIPNEPTLSEFVLTNILIEAGITVKRFENYIQNLKNIA
ncbi:MAG: hypothetical protein M0D57_03000 [Sphingobacteriales bacterium JAD_PAG50586_3]|nr:MAG: hypothetical protein M0D57_03000 [Sphingobacteriales bacterium JAD_PAG50586_3]